MTESFQKLTRPAALKGTIFFLLLLFLITMSSPLFLKILGVLKINGTVLLISRLLFWVCAGLAWWYSIKIDKQNLLIWQEKKYSFLFYLLSFIAILLVIISGMFCIQLIISLSGLIKKSTVYAELTVIFKTNLPLLIFTCLTAGVTEELIFRGFLLPRLEIIFKNPWAASIVSSLLFGLMHAKYGTIINIAGPVFIGFVFAYYYWKYRNIKILILFHFLWDLSLLLIAVKANRP
jgi:membrane protease YdiL (CAAX protease family)